MPGVYENATYEPEADQAWFEFYYIPNAPVVVTMGDAGFDEHTGIVQINLNYPLNAGSGSALAMADQIRALFPAGSRHTFNTQTVKVRSCGVTGAGQLVNGYYQLILTITYTARTTR